MILSRESSALCWLELYFLAPRKIDQLKRATRIFSLTLLLHINEPRYFEKPIKNKQSSVLFVGFTRELITDALLINRAFWWRVNLAGNSRKYTYQPVDDFDWFCTVNFWLIVNRLKFFFFSAKKQDFFYLLDKLIIGPRVFFLELPRKVGLTHLSYYQFYSSLESQCVFF